MSLRLLRSSSAASAREPAGWRGSGRLSRSTPTRCRPPSTRTAASGAATASVQQIAPRRSHHEYQQQQQHSRPADQQGFAGLASYRFRTADVNCRWLETVVREAVVHLAQAPFLQVTQTSRGARQPSFSCVPLPGTNSISSQTWHDLTRQLGAAQRDAESVLYLAPLQPSPAHTSDASTPGAPPNAARRPRRAEVLTGIEQTPLVRGRVGDCCDEDGNYSSGGHAATAGTVSQILPYVHAARAEARSRGGDGRHSSAEEDSAPRALREGSSAVKAEWGLVLQSRWHEGLNGCYILSTSTSGEPGCDCTHFSVVRAQEGQGVTEQILSAWRT